MMKNQHKNKQMNKIIYLKCSIAKIVNKTKEFDSVFVSNTNSLNEHDHRTHTHTHRHVDYYVGAFEFEK